MTYSPASDKELAISAVSSSGYDRRSAAVADRQEPVWNDPEIHLWPFRSSDLMELARIDRVDSPGTAAGDLSWPVRAQEPAGRLLSPSEERREKTPAEAKLGPARPVTRR